MPRSLRGDASFHLLRAAQLLRADFLFRSEDEQAPDLERAAGVAMQLHFCLEPAPFRRDLPHSESPMQHRPALLAMAEAARVFRVKTRTKDAEDALLVVLPPSASEALRKYGERAARIVAQTALKVLADQGFAGAAKMRRRWALTDELRLRPEQLSEPIYLSSSQFRDDVDELTSDIDEMLLEKEKYEGDRFAHAVVRRIFKLLRLGRALEALKAKERRSKI